MTEEKYQQLKKNQSDQYNILSKKAECDTTGLLKFLWELMEWYFQRNILIQEEEKRNGE